MEATMTEAKETDGISRCLTFQLENEIFAVDVACVREVLDAAPITRMPNAPDFMRGVINVRGAVVPVADLRTKFGLSAAETTQNTRFIVLELILDGEPVILGVIADSVYEVTDIHPDHVNAPPNIGSRWKTDFIRGVGRQKDQFIIILDIQKIFSGDDRLIAAETEETAAA